MLKITKANEQIEVKQLVVVVYGAPGLGKSTLGFSTDDPILLDFDAGAYRAANRKDTVLINSWEDVTSITPDDLKPFKTVVVDTAGRALDFLTADIIRRVPKMGYGGVLTLQGYGKLKAEFAAWLKNLKTMGKDVVLLSHMSEERKGDELIERIDIQGGSKAEIYKSADAMARLYMDDGKRVLNFSPTDVAFGKNPGNFDPFNVSDIENEPDFLGAIIALIKERLNALTEDQKKRMRVISDWKEKISQADNADKLSKLVAEVLEVEKNIQPTIKGLLHKHATGAGFKFEDGGYK